MPAKTATRPARGAGTTPKADGKTLTANVVVHLKPGISDPEGQNTLKALHLLGFSGVTGVHATRAWNIELRAPSRQAARAEVERMCRRLLTNPVIHDYSIDVRG